MLKILEKLFYDGYSLENGKLCRCRKCQIKRKQTLDLEEEKLEYQIKEDYIKQYVQIIDEHAGPVHMQNYISPTLKTALSLTNLGTDAA